MPKLARLYVVALLMSTALVVHVVSLAPEGARVVLSSVTGLIVSACLGLLAAYMFQGDSKS